MSYRSKSFLTLIALILLISLSACGGNKTNNGAKDETPAENNGSTTVNTAEAESLYGKNCVSCHAVDLAGGVGPNLQNVGAELSVDQISAQISNGGNGMPAYKGQLKDEEIAVLANWLAGHK
ncbi:c-type cytochrome [Paenibacillus sinopodophylli]|uniref:c-type cytochrome n=1 Tax=Paenibacillus sinopodophylli TaxID=1837342 RepID=UPI00110C8F1E|nr:cytochrome c [Paenibacillus sinopodophylli]